MDLNEVINVAVLENVPQQPQVQCSKQDQLAALKVIAERFGLYDAADHIGSILNRPGPRFVMTDTGVKTAE